MKLLGLITVSAIVGGLAGSQIGVLLAAMLVAVACAAVAVQRLAIALWCVAVSPLFVGLSIAGLPFITTLAAGLWLGYTFSVLSGSGAPNLRSVPLPLISILILGIGVALRPPVTQEGRFSVLEQSVILLLIVFWTIVPTGPRDSLRLRLFAFHAGLCGTSIAAGVSSWLALLGASSIEVASRQIAGSFGASNYVAALLTACAVACLHQALRGEDRAVNYALLLFMVLLAAPQASRTSTAILVAVAALMIIRSTGIFLPILVMAVASFAGSLRLTAIPAIARFQDPTGSFNNLNGRADLWAFGWHQFATHPLLGSGGGRLTDVLVFNGSSVLYVHNFMLSLLSQYGLLGIPFLLVLCWPSLRGELWSYAWTVSLTILGISLLEPAVETLKLGILYSCLFGVLVLRSRGRAGNIDIRSDRSSCWPRGTVVHYSLSQESSQPSLGHQRRG